MPRYILLSNGQRLDFTEYVNNLRTVCGELRGDEKQKKAYAQARDLLFAALLYGGTQEEVSEAQLSALVKEQSKKANVAANIETLKALAAKEDDLICRPGLPGYLQQIYFYAFDYSDSEKSRQEAAAFDKYAASYTTSGVMIRARFTIDAIQKVLDLRDEDLVPENEAAARQFILNNYHALHLGEKIDTLLDSLGGEFDLIGPQDMVNKDHSRRYFSSKDKVLQSEKQAIADALLHKQKLIRNVLLYEKKWLTQYDPDRFTQELSASLERCDVRPDGRYDDIKVNILNIAENAKGLRLEKTGRLLEGTGLSLDDLEELVRARMVDEKLALLPGINTMNADDLAAHTARLAAGLDAEEVYQAMDSYARKVSAENKDAEGLYDYQHPDETGRRVPPKPAMVLFTDEYNAARSSGSAEDAERFLQVYASSILADPDLPDYQKLQAYQMTHELLRKYVTDPESFAYRAGSLEAYARLVDFFEEMEELGPKLLEENFNKEAVKADILFMDHLVRRAETDQKLEKERRERTWEYDKYRADLLKEGIDLAKILSENNDLIAANYRNYSYVHGHLPNGLRVTEAFGDNPNYAEKKRSPNAQAFRVQLALLGFAPERFPGSEGKAFENKIDFIHNLLSDPDFRTENKNFVTSQKGESVMSAYDELEKNYRLTPEAPRIQQVYAGLLYTALKSANTIAMYHPGESAKLALLAHAVQNITQRYELDRNLAKSAQLLELEERYADFGQVRTMSKGIVELSEVQRKALEAKVSLLRSISPKDTDPEVIGDLLAGRVITSLLEKDCAENSPLFKQGKDPVSPTLLLLSRTVDGKPFSQFISGIIRSTPTARALTGARLDRLRDMLVREEAAKRDPAGKAAAQEHDGLKLLTDKIFTEAISLIPKSVAQDIQKQVLEAQKSFAPAHSPAPDSGEVLPDGEVLPGGEVPALPSSN